MYTGNMHTGRNRVLVVVLLSLVLAGLAAYGTGDVDFGHSPLVPFYRLYSAASGNHLYTTNAQEVMNLVLSGDFRSEGRACYVFADQVLGTVPLYRFRDPAKGGHFYTIDQDEAAEELAESAVMEHIAGYVFAEPRQGTVAVLRFWNPVRQDHFYSTSIENDTNLEYQEVAFYSIAGDETIPLVHAWNWRNEDSLLLAGYSFATEKLNGGAPLSLAGYALGRGILGTTPLYRFYVPEAKDHVFTTDLQGEGAELLAGGAIPEGVIGYVFSEPETGLIPVHRVWVPELETHYFTANEKDYRLLLQAAGNVDEGVPFYLLSSTDD